MEITLSDIISIIGLLAGGGGLGVFFTWKYSRRKERAEAESAETGAAKEKQDYYQQLLTDLQGHHEELRQERDHYKRERDELREKMDKLTASVAEWKQISEDERLEMKREMARLTRRVDAMTPLLCGDMSCMKRQRVIVGEDGDINKHEL